MTITEGVKTKVALFDSIKVKRRYSRSVNLERDLEISDSVNGYIVSPKVEGLINRFIDSITTPNAVRAWTITGAYGTGKSSFAHFLSAICSSREEEIRKNVYNILKFSNINSHKINRAIPERGFIKAVVTAQREPIANTLVRGLKYGYDRFYSNARGQKGQMRSSLDDLYERTIKGEHISGELVLKLLIDFGKSSKSGIIIIVDELGKNLEYCSQNQATADLYLLQQIAELPSGAINPRIFFLGLLHQAFYDYSHGLASSQRNEWMKIQGRFEDISFAESPARLVHLIADAIDQSGLDALRKRQIGDWARNWKAALTALELGRMNISDIGHIYPFHPLCALVLPVLCNKFAQNDRTLFTFLASDEPHSFKAFLKSAEFDGKLPMVKVHNLYDFFIESASIAITARSQNQKWIEIQSRISELSNLDSDSLNTLKTIGILNLIANMGSLKASPKTVALSLCDDPVSDEAMEYWLKVIEDLALKGIVRYVNAIDGLRIWEGTDFDLEKELAEEIQRVDLNLTNVLNELSPLKPLVARKHSYVAGTTRYFERYYADTITGDIRCNRIESDGVIVYMAWKLTFKESIQSFTEDGKPVIVICATDTKALRHAANEYAALQNIKKNRKELLSDGVARKEVRHRLYIAEEILKNHIEKAFDVTKAACYITGRLERFSDVAAFNARFSALCDEIYSRGPVLWNELINKRELTSQGAKARRELIEAMLSNAGIERLGLIGHGPECSMYDSVLLSTGIHAFNGENWEFGGPKRDSGVYHVWMAIEDFCKASKETPQFLETLYAILRKPPYGMKQGAIPVLLLSVFLYHSDYLSLYYDGSYIPVLGTEHFELLTKKPALFAVKYLEVSGLRIKLFEELGEIVSSSGIKDNKRIRNVTLLSIINPLVKFVQRLPKYTKETDNLSFEAKAVRHALINAKDPEELLFRTLPQACGYSFIDSQSGYDGVVKAFRKKLVMALQELQVACDNLLSRKKKLLGDAFSVRKDSGSLREYLRAIAHRVNSHTAIIELTLKRFIQAVINKDLDDRAWLESVLMVVSDKPVDSWSDKDALSFEIKLGEIVRRFKSVESIIELAPDLNRGFEARKVTVTPQDGVYQRKCA